MRYPDKILPNETRQYIQSVGDECCFIRTIKIENFELDKFFSDKEKLDEAVFNATYSKVVCDPRKQVESLSLSLYGDFGTDETQIELTEEGKSIYSVKCECDAVVDEIPIYNEHFIIKSSYSYWVCKKSCINSINVRLNLKNGTTIVPTLTPVHDPYLWNYWHFELRIYDQDGNQLDFTGIGTSNNEKRNYFGVLREAILGCITLGDAPECCYHEH